MTIPKKHLLDLFTSRVNHLSRSKSFTRGSFRQSNTFETIPEPDPDSDSVYADRELRSEGGAVSQKTKEPKELKLSRIGADRTGR